jgi:hypothetical protein
MTTRGSNEGGRITIQGAQALQNMGWNILLQEWSRCLDDYDRPTWTQRDVAYWYGGRALNGLLAAAAWRLRGEGTRDIWALEEFGEGFRNRQGDMWLAIGSGIFTIRATLQCGVSANHVHGFGRVMLQILISLLGS